LWLQANQVGGDIGKPIRLVSRVPELDHQIPSLEVTVLSQPLLEGVENAGDLRTGRCRPEKSYPDHVGRLLSVGAERCGERSGQRGQQEAAAVHAGMVGRVRSVVKRVAHPEAAACRRDLRGTPQSPRKSLKEKMRSQS
jgi:hypothetical protein